MYTLTRAELDILRASLPERADEALRVLAQVEGRGRRGEPPGLAEGLRLLEVILRVTELPLCVTDEAGRFVLVNDPYCALYGYRREEMIGQEVTLIVPPELHPGAMDFYRMMLAGEMPVASQEWGAVRRDGRRLAVSSTRVRVQTQQGVLLMHTVQNLDEQRREEEARAQLETRAAHNLRLESLALLAGGVAHDFNNLLAGILANATLLREDRDVDVAGIASELEHAARRASGLIQTLQEYARQQPATQSEEELGRLTKDTMRLLKTFPGAERLVWRQPARPVRTVISGSQIQQVIMNLMVNALEASARDAGSVWVAVELREIGADGPLDMLSGARVAPGRWAAVEVRDQGVGLVPGTAARLFDPFYTTKGPGRGLGLASSGSIIRAHGGAMTVESAPGQGATFTLLLPCWGHDAA